MPRPRTLASLSTLLGVAAVAACSWSVPADPGRNARLRRPRRAPAGTEALVLSGRAPGADPAAAAIYEDKCAQCHAPIPPTFATAEDWPVFVRRYGPRAGLFGAERARVLAWLQGNAAR
jgi:hypothetical protein